MTFRHRLSRRRFLQQAAAAGAVIGLPAIIPASALGAEGRPAPSNRITVGAIGVGGQGNGNLGGFLGDPRCQVVAVNDVDRNNAENTQRRVNEVYNNQDCAAYRGLPRTGRAGRHRRHLAGHARPLARHPGDPVRQIGQGHLRREAVQPRSARRPGDGRRRQPVRPHLADRLVAAIHGRFPLRLRTGPQRPHRQGAHGRGRPAHRRRRRQRAVHRPAAEHGLRFLVRARRPGRRIRPTAPTGTGAGRWTTAAGN